MKIEEIRLTAFRNHVDTRIKGLSTVNIFAGANAAGKSTIIDAIAFALTGTCRGTDDGGRGAESLATQGIAIKDTTTAVSLKTSKGDITRGLGQGPRSQAHVKIVGRLGLDEGVLKVLAAPTNLLRLPARKQEELFFGLTGKGLTPEMIECALKESGLSSANVNIEDIMTPDGRAEKLSHYKEKRVELKRQRDTLVYTAPDKKLPKPNPERRNNLSKDIETAVAGLKNASGAQQSYDYGRQQLEALIKQEEIRLESLTAATDPSSLTDEQEADIKRQIEAHSEAVIERNGKSHALDGLNQDLARLKAEAARVKALGNSCEACGQEISKKHADETLDTLRKEYARVGGEIKSVAKDIDARDKRLDGNNIGELQKQLNESIRARERAHNNAGAIQQGQANIADIKARIAKLVAPKNDIDAVALEAQIKTWKDEFELLREAEYEATRQIDTNRERSVIEASLEEIEKIIKVIGPGGSIQQLMAADGTSEMAAKVTAIGNKLGVGDIAIQLSPWQIQLNGRSIELASASEQFRVAAAFGMAFAAKAGASIVCLDGAEILFGDNRDFFSDALFESGLEQIFVAVSVDKIPNPEYSPDFSYYAVTRREDGSAIVSWVNCIPAQGVAA